MQFKDITGLSATKRRLIEAVKAGRVPHAQLFVGPEGTGKLPLALAYAQYLACKNRTDEDSCGQCPTCLQFGNLQHPDLHFVFPIVKTDAGDVCDYFVSTFRETLKANPYMRLQDWYEALGVETKQGLIYEKEAGEILRKLSLHAFGDGYKTMVIWLPEKMNATCANRLLKILEEPPKDTLFLLVSEEPGLLLETIRSRVQEVLVKEECRECNEESVKSIESDAEACEMWFEDFIALMRNAYTIGQLKDPQKKFDSLKAIREWSLKMASSDVGRERQKAFLQYAQRQIRENYIQNLVQGLAHQTDEEAAFSSRFAPFIHDGNVERIMLELDKAETQIAQNGNAKMIFFDMCLQMIVLIKR